MRIKKNKFLFVLFLVAFQLQITFGQSTVVPDIKSPNTAALEKFGEIPVSLFTGTPDISIPLHVIETGSIKVPISLSYHPSSVKPNVNPGWVGLGWNLNSYGSISRQMRKSPDEIDFASPGSMAYVRSYYPAPNSKNDPSSMDLQVANWYSKEKLEEYADNSAPDINKDVEADEFSFNFLGHSGKFYYDAVTQKWVVVSNENIKIEMDGFISFVDRLKELDKYKGLRKDLDNNGFSSLTNQFQGQNDEKSRAFKGFTLITEDGTRYSFGGVEAIEFTSYYYSPTFNDVNTDTWLLNKIVDVNGNSVEFKYERTYVNCNLYDNYYFGGLAWWNLRNGYLDNSSQVWLDPKNTHPRMKVTGSYIYPVNLTKIITKNETVEFSSQIATTLKYPENVMKLNMKDVNPSSPSSYPYLENFNYVTDWFKWLNLYGLYIKSNVNGNYVKKYTFDYYENSNQRLALKGINKFFDRTTQKYTFTYNNLESLPNSLMGPMTDHWGFLNSYDNGAFGSLFPFEAKNANRNYVTLGLLKTINYPTNGYTEFDWESNSYSQVVSKTRNGLDAYSGFGGGSRIKEIRSFSDTNILASKKSYYYVKGYSAAVNVNALASSGVLNGIPKYEFVTAKEPVRESRSGYYKVEYSETSQNTISNYSYAGHGAPVGYDEVVEANLDGSYTKHYFTNYGPDLNNVSHFDQIALGSTGWISGDDSYMPYSSLELERGKEIGTYDYNSGNKLVRSSTFSFRNDVARFDEYLRKVVITQVCPVDHGNDMFVFAVGLKNFTYQYYPIQNTITTYDVNGTNPIVQTKQFTYNSKNQLASETSFNSDGVSLKNIYYYPYDTQVQALPFNSDLVSANRIGLPVKTETFKGTQKIFDKVTVFGRDSSTRLVLPKNDYAANFPNNLPSLTSPNVGKLESKVTYDKYDDNGNILQYTPLFGSSTVIVWGYNKSVPIAKIENAVYNDVAPYIASLQAFSNSNDELNLTIGLNNLRTSLSNALVTTYTYLPLVGINSITDPKGISIFYGYDNFNRLSYIRDQNLNVLERYCYNYKGQLTNCNQIYSNTAITGSFKKDCGSGTTTPIEYRIAAGTYTSVISQADAQAQAQKAAQAYANNTGVCTYSSVSKMQSFTRNNCASGGEPETRVYVVSAGKYTSTVSQADADAQAQRDIDQNGQAYVNSVATCTFYSASRSADFTRDNCEKDKKGSIVTYTQPLGKHWSFISQADADAKAQAAFNSEGRDYAIAHGNCAYYNTTTISKSFAKKNCPINFYGKPRLHTIYANTIISHYSQADANEFAEITLENEGRAYANLMDCSPIGFVARGNFNELLKKLEVVFTADDGNHSGRIFNLKIANYTSSGFDGYIYEQYELKAGQSSSPVILMGGGGRATYASIVSTN
ncbi:DUF5977 domain-containing protein [Flavobacterium hercynium]|nr:DUF5977 domain-containing protein [Flavobacterium hercynium]